MVALLLGLLQLFSVSGSDSLVDHSKSQAKYYITQIENDSDIEENLWALTILGSEKDEIKPFIEENSGSTEILSAFINFESDYQSQLKKVVYQTGFPNLLVALLLTAEGKTQKRKIYNEYLSKFDLPVSNEVNYDKLSKAIINGNKIKTDFLSDHTFLLPHFFLLYDNNYSTFFSERYYSNLVTNWKSNFSSDPSLRNSLEEVSYLRALYLLKNYSKIEPLYTSLVNNNLFPQSSLKLRIYQYLDYVMYRLGFYDRSLTIVRNIAIPLSKYLEQKSKKLHFTQLQGVYLYSIGEIQQSEKIYQRVLSEIDPENPQITLSSLYNNLALTYLNLGKYEQYLDLLYQALENARESNNYSHELEILNNLFIYHRNSNNPKRALNYLEEARRIAENEGSLDDLGTIYTSLGSFYRKFHENYPKAHEFFAKADEALDAENNARYYIKLLHEQAETFENQQYYSQAIKKHNQIIALTNNKNGANYLDALVNKALIYLKMGDTEKAEQFITKFNSFDLSKLDFQQIIKAKTVEANYLHQTGKSQKAIDILGPTLDQIVTRAKSSADLKSGYWHVAQEFLDAFELTVSIYRKMGQDGKAIQILDQLKTINDASLYQNPLVKSSLLNESELTEYKRLTEQLDATRKKLLTAPEDQQFEIQQTISQLNLKKRKLDQKLTKQVGSKSVSVREIQNHLSARELVLHITELKDQYYIANISRSDISINTIPIDSTLSNLLSGSVQQLATNETNLDSLYKISQILNLREIPDYVEEVTLIPDSDFYQLPVDILPLEKPTHSYSYGDVTYAIEKFRTQYLTSLEDFIADPSERSNSHELNYAGYGISSFEGYNNQSLVSLPFAQTEVTNIANRLTRFSNVQTYINKQSTKSTFEQTAPKSQIIHLATHSEVSERDPMFSTIYMSNTTSSSDSTFDGQIFAYELFELNLDNEMIMLNSCESGSGSFIPGTGVMGISRALRYAGANSLVLNLWSVNDMLASDFAIHFYDQLNQGKSKAEALRDTKRYFLNSKNASPHFWGPYMLIGNPDSIIEPDKDNNMAMAGTFIIYFLLMVSLSYLTQQGFIFRSQSQDNRKAA